MINELISSTLTINQSLKDHSLYKMMATKEDLCFFMERHVFAVLDFMSLLSALKRNLLPADTFWTPRENNDVTRFLNEINLAEESDEDQEGNYLSHFELYLQAMEEVGAKTQLVTNFIKHAKVSGISSALNQLSIPKSSSHFIGNTFSLIEENSTHRIAASFCFGREKSIPIMFQAILEKIGINQKQAPKFHYYIKRHIEIDGDEHGPMSENLLTMLCQSDSIKWSEAKDSAISSLNAREKFWDQILEEMQERN
jgi:uncharacterized protein YktA (UPF0223 family)